MAGPAIRAIELARVLAHEHDVLVVSPELSEVDERSIGLHRFTSNSDLARTVRGSDVLIAIGSFLNHHEGLARSDTIVVADLYDPAVLEALVQHGQGPIDEQLRVHREALRGLRHQLARGDLFLCASARQRHLVLGMLTAMGRINPATYGADPALAELVRVVPFGLPAPPEPMQRPGPLRSRFGISADDVVALWGGGLYEWLDPLSLVEAVAGVADERVKAVFMGMAHPTSDVPAMPVAARAVDRARELGLLGHRVFFSEGWVPYRERAQHLLDSDIGVSLHHDHIESTFAFRTRVLDYIWAGLPTICSDGDVLADVIRDRGIGEVVPVGDVVAIQRALERLADATTRAGLAARLPAVAATLRWDTVARPIVEFCRSPVRAPDRVAPYRRLRRRVDIGDHLHAAMSPVRGFVRRRRPEQSTGDGEEC